MGEEQVTNADAQDGVDSKLAEVLLGNGENLGGQSGLCNVDEVLAEGCIVVAACWSTEKQGLRRGRSCSVEPVLPVTLWCRGESEGGRRARAYPWFSAALVRAARATSTALRQPLMMACGWNFLSISASAWRSSSEASTVTLVVPSPTSLSWTCEISVQGMGVGVVVRGGGGGRREHRWLTDEHFGGGVVDADALEDGGAVVGHVHLARVGVALQDLVLRKIEVMTKIVNKQTEKKNPSICTHHALRAESGLDQIANGNGANERRLRGRMDAW